MEQLTLEIKNVQLNYLDSILLDIDHLSVYQFNRIGIVGEACILDQPTNFLDVYAIQALKRFIHVMKGVS